MRPVSIFIPTYGHWEYTNVCLACLVNLSKQEIAMIDEIIFVDTIPPHPDQTQEQLNTILQKGLFSLNSFPPSLFKIVFLDKNYGCTITINKGIEACKPENDVMFVSNDIFFGPQWLAPLQRYAYWKDCVGVVSPYIAPEICLDEIVNAQFRKNYFDTEYMKIIFEKSSTKIYQWLGALYGGDMFKFSTEFVKRNKDKIYDDGHTASMYLKRETLNKIGVFDDRFSYLFTGMLGGYGSDDIDYGIRLNNAGLFRVTCFESFCHHLVCGTNRKRTNPNNNDIQSGNKLIKKWEHDSTSPELLFPFEVAGKKVPHRRFKLRETPLPPFASPFQLDWGLPGEIGKEYMINYGREDAFP